MNTKHHSALAVLIELINDEASQITVRNRFASGQLAVPKQQKRLTRLDPIDLTHQGSEEGGRTDNRARYR